MVGLRVVIIGAGVVGASLADELSARGWDSITVLDKGPLPEPGGSSSHAPGLVFQTSPAKTMTQLAQYTVRKLGGLADSGQPCFLPVGGLEVATSQARLAELHRRAGWLASWGVPGEVVEPGRCIELVPMLDRAQLLGGLHVPTDGLAKAVRAVTAQLSRARERGVRVADGTEVLDVRTDGGRVTGVLTTAGELAADIVVCCAGIWGPKVAAMVGLPLPLVPLAHQLAWTGQVPALAGQRQEAVRPILRHQDADLYYREQCDRLAIGYYGHRPMPVDVGDIRSVAESEVMPSVQPFTEEDFAQAWRVTNRLLPSTNDTKIERGINGLFSFTTDDMPLLGESPEVDGFWVAEAVWVTHSAGVGRAMAEWLVDGGCTSFDLHGCELNRFEAHQLAPEYVLRTGCRNFVEVYDIKHPLRAVTETGVPRTSPFHCRQTELGGAFLQSCDWARPQWYAANADLVDGHDTAAPDPWAARHWSPIVGAEARHTREAVALYDMTPLNRLEVTGPGAAAFLDRMCSGQVDKPVGSVTYTLLLDAGGRIRGDVTLARLATEHFQVGVNSALEEHWLRRHLPTGRGAAPVTVRDITAGTCCIGLWGPRARDVLAPLTRTDLTSETGLRYFRGTRTHVAELPVTLLRLSYVGELGWEIYTSAELGLRLWDTLFTAGAPHGLIAAGRGALQSLRLEKGYRAFGTDMTFEHDRGRPASASR